MDSKSSLNNLIAIFFCFFSAHYRQRPGYDGQKAHNWKLIAMTFLWWWVFYGIWTDPGHVFGHTQFQPPDPRKWSDTELGIPQD